MLLYSRVFLSKQRTFYDSQVFFFIREKGMEQSTIRRVFSFKVTFPWWRILKQKIYRQTHVHFSHFKIQEKKQQGSKKQADKKVSKHLLHCAVKFVSVTFMTQLGGCHKSFRWKHRKTLCVSLLGLSTTDKNNNWYFQMCSHLVLSYASTHMLSVKIYP